MRYPVRGIMYIKYFLYHSSLNVLYCIHAGIEKKRRFVIYLKSLTNVPRRESPDVIPLFTGAPGSVAMDTTPAGWVDLAPASGSPDQTRTSARRSRSSQCSTTGVTKAVVCAILSVGWCI